MYLLIFIDKHKRGLLLAECWANHCRPLSSVAVVSSATANSPIILTSDKFCLVCCLLEGKGETGNFGPSAI